MRASQDHASSSGSSAPKSGQTPRAQIEELSNHFLACSNQRGYREWERKMYAHVHHGLLMALAVIDHDAASQASEIEEILQQRVIP